jgi:putative transposase
LPPHIRKLSPPGYWKDRETGEKEIHILIRNDRYYLEPISEDEGYIVLEDFDLRIRYGGRIRWEGKQGRLEIIYVNGRWFAHIPIEVGIDPPKSNPKGYVKPIYDDEERKKKKQRITNPKSIKQRDPIGDKEAFIDMGLNNLFAAVISDGSALLVKGGSIKSEYYWWRREIAVYQSIRDVLRRLGVSTWINYHEKYLDAMYKRNERLRHLYIAAIRFLADELYRRGVRKLYIGYPIMLSQNNGNEYNTNIWWFRKIVLWIVDIFMEYGIEVEIVPEDYTSRECSICGNKHKNGRKYRGLYICKKTGKKINADINAALNIARRLGRRIRISRKIESYHVTHSGVKPLIPRQRANTRDPSIETRPFRAGRGHITTDITKAYEILKSYVTTRRGIEVIFTLGPLGAHPAMQLVRDLNMVGKLFVSTVDLDDKIIAGIRDGVTIAAVSQQPFAQGFLPVVYMYLYVKFGVKPPSQIPTGPTIIDKSLIDLVLKQIKETGGA